MQVVGTAGAEAVDVCHPAHEPKRAEHDLRAAVAADRITHPGFRSCTRVNAGEDDG